MIPPQPRPQFSTSFLYSPSSGLPILSPRTSLPFYPLQPLAPRLTITNRYSIQASTDPNEDDLAWADAERQVREAGSAVVSVKSQLKKNKKRKADEDEADGVNGDNGDDAKGKKEKKEKKKAKTDGDGHRSKHRDGEKSKSPKGKKDKESSKLKKKEKS